MLFNMGHLAQSDDMRVLQLEAAIPGMIKRDIVAALTPFLASIDALAAIVEVCERGRGVDTEVTTLKANLARLCKDVDQLKSIDHSMLFCTVDIPDVTNSDIPSCSDVPPDTTGDEVRADDIGAASEAEMNEEQLADREEVAYEDMVDLEGAMYETARQASLRDTSMVAPLEPKMMWHQALMLKQRELWICKLHLGLA
ncbi:hypothetical protein H5410_002339 [Solanum commersonii]|uniref:Polyprotein protein n=1 Tax=Solanum commersonii TaxID=4109 RepID=A0A9J6B1M2_SOLCO|nr:hypothetical protein H5410_002339 [Solanum commersonii]